MKKYLFHLVVTIALLFFIQQRASADPTYLLTQNFNNISSGIPSGWNNDDGNAITEVYKWRYNANGRTGGCLQFNTSAFGVLGTINMLKTPSVDMSTGSWILKFWYKNPGNGGDLSIFVSTDGGMTYYTPIAQGLPNYVSEWTEVQLQLTPAQGYSNVQVVFQATNNGMGSLMYLDDVTIESEPTCQAPRDLYVSGTTTTTTNLSWSLNPFGSTPSSYYMTVTDEFGNTVINDTNLIAPNNTTTITGLTPNTRYTVQLRGNCISSYGGVSEMGTITFDTRCTPQSGLIFEDFNGITELPRCLVTEHASVATAGVTGKGLELVSGVNENAYIIMPPIAEPSNNVEVTLWIRPSTAYNGASILKVGIVTDPNDVSGTFEDLYTDTLDLIAWQEITMNTALTAEAVTPNTYIAIVILSGFSRYFTLDDITVHAIPTCSRPENVRCKGSTETTLAIGWDEPSAANAIIELTSTSGTSSYTATSNPYTVTGLTSNTEYSIRVRRICSPTDTSAYNRIAVKAKTLCVADTSPLLNESFESLAAYDAAPECWQMGWFSRPSTESKATPFFRSSSISHTGSYCMYLQNQANGTRSYLSTKMLPVSQPGKYTLSVWIYRENAPNSYEGLKFWAGPNNCDTTGATLLGYIPINYSSAPAENNGNKWYNYEFVINASGNIHIIIEGISTGTDIMYFDDVEVKLTPTCFKVRDIALSNPDAQGVNMSWTPGRDETQWIVDYTLRNGATVVRTVHEIVTTDSVRIDSLVSGTTYTLTATVTSYCGDDDFAESVLFTSSFTTACVPISALPYSCSFEASEDLVGSYPLPMCWTRFNPSFGSDNAYPVVGSSSSVARKGSGYLNFYPVALSAGNDAYQVAVLPEIDTTIYQINTLRMTFYAASSTNLPCTLYIGVMEDPGDISTFVAVDSLDVNNVNYFYHTTNFTFYTGSGKYLALCAPKTGAYTNLYIDDLKVDLIPTCVDIMTPMITDYDATSATIYNNDASALYYSIAYGPAGTPVYNCTIIDTIGSYITLTGLTPRTSYVLYTRNKCSAVNYGSWSDSVSFTTLCVAESIPFFEDFESEPVDALNNCLSLIVPTARVLKVFEQSSPNATGKSMVNHTFNGSKGVSLAQNASKTTTTTTNGDIQMLVNASLEQGKYYECSIYAKAFVNPLTDNNYHLDIVFYDSLNYYTTLANYYIDVDTWTRCSGIFRGPSTGNYQVGVRMSHGDVLGYYTPFVDDLEIVEIDCPKPSSVSVEDIATDSAILNISSSADRWEVVVSSTQIDTSQITGDIMHDTVSTSNLVINGLMANTMYYFTVRTICGSEDASPWVVPGSFRTLCGIENVPATEGFENPSSTLCWNVLTGNGNISRSKETRHTGTGAMLLSSVNAISPEFNVTTFAPYVLTGWAFTAGEESTFDVGVVTDPNDLSTYDVISTVTIPADSWTEFNAYFSLLNDPMYAALYNARYIVIATSNNNIYLDDLTIDTLPACPAPNDGSIGAITTQSATIDWVENGTATQWKLRVAPEYGSEINATVTAHPYTVTGLTPATKYAVFVSSLCNDTSHEHCAGVFTTECDMMTPPYSEIFEESQTDKIPLCWHNPNMGLSTEWRVMSHNGNKALYLDNPKVSQGTSSISSPDIILESGKNYELVYDYCNQYDGGNLEVKIGEANSQNKTLMASHQASGVYSNKNPQAFLPNIIDISSYAGDTINLQFSVALVSAVGAVWVDNIHIREIGSCTEPISIAVKSINEHDALVIISDTLPTHTSWQYAIGQKGMDVNAATLINVTSDSIHLTSLATSTAYDVYVRSVCAAGIYSPWLRKSFCTTGAPATLPYICDFSDATENSKWQSLGIGDNIFTFGSDPNALFGSGTSAMYISNGGTYGYDINTPSYVAMSRLFQFEEKEYVVEFDWKCTGGEINGDYARFYLIPADCDPLPENYSGAVVNQVYPPGMIALDGGYARSIVFAPQHVTRTINFTGRSGSYLLVFFWGNNFIFGNSQYPLSVSNVSVSELTCTPPTVSVVASSITSNSATVQCGGRTGVTRWAISTTQFVADSILTGVTTTDNFTISGLPASTNCYLFIRNECSASDISPWTITAFMTECAPVNEYPYSVDFESNTFPPVCWESYEVSHGTSGSEAVNCYWERKVYLTSGFGGGTAGAHLMGAAGGSTVLATPAFIFDADRDYHLKFTLYRSTSQYMTDKLKVYMGNNPSLENAVLLKAITAYSSQISANGVEYFDIDIEPLSDEPQYILFEGLYYNSGYIYLDDISVEMYPLCRELTTYPNVEGTSSTSIVVSEPIGSHSAIEFGIAQFAVSATPAAITSTIISTDGYATFTGLNLATSYAVFARAICNETGDTTSWTSHSKATTKADDCYAPEGLKTEGMVTDTSVVVSWVANPGATGYECLFTTPTASDTTVVSTTMFTRNNLTSDTRYSLKVRTFCASGDTTAWSSPYSFKTIPEPAQLPYVTGFEQTDDNYHWVSTTSMRQNNFVIAGDGLGNNNSAGGLYISDNATSYSQSLPHEPSSVLQDVYNVAYISRTIYFPAVGKYDVSFDWKCAAMANIGSSYTAYGRAFLTNAGTLLPSDSERYATALPSGAIKLENKLQDNQTWQRSTNVVYIAQPCFMEIVFMWYAENKGNKARTSDVSDIPLAIDNLSIHEVQCVPPTSVIADIVSDTFARVISVKAEMLDIEYALLTVNNADSITSVVTIPAMSVNDTIDFTGLQPETQYYFFARSVCDSASKSSWRVLTFTTTSEPALVPYVCDFEDDTENSKWQLIHSGNNEFITGTATTIAGNRTLYVSDNNSSYSYNTSGYSTAYAIRLLYLEEGLHEYSYQWSGNGEGLQDYARVILLPVTTTISAGQTLLPGLDALHTPANAIALDGGAALNLNTAVTTVADTFSINHRGSYNFVVAWVNNYMDGANPPFAIDNISIKETSCTPPSNRILLVSDTGALFEVAKTSQDSRVVYALSTDGSTDNIIVMDTLGYGAAPDTVSFSNLNSATMYCMMSRLLCSDDDQSLWNRTWFKTLCGVVTTFPYTEGFETMDITYRKGIEDYICWSALNDTTTYPNFHATSSYQAYSGEKSLLLSSSNETPLFLALPEMNDINGLSLTFFARGQSGFSYYGIVYPGYMTNIEDATTFVPVDTVVLTTSWVRHQADFSNVPAGAHIAFRYSDAPRNGYYGFIDDVRVSRSYTAPAYYDTICSNENYMLHGFNVTSAEMTTGLNVLTRTYYASEPNQSDTIYTANVFKRPAYQNITYDTICAGESYVSGLWNIPSPKSQHYFHTFPGAATCGCDSSVDLYLTVLPITHYIQDTICKGQSIMFGDTLIRTAGTHIRTYLTERGCVNTDTLVLTLIPDSVVEFVSECSSNLPYIWRGMLVYNSGQYTKQIIGPLGCWQTAVLNFTILNLDSVANVSFCKGGSVQVADTIIRTSGIYTLQRINDLGCEVVYHITATEVNPTVQHVYDQECEGKAYYGYGIFGLIVHSDTIVEINTRTIDGQCDSVSNIHINVIKTVYTDTTATIPAGGYITWHENTYTKPGDYPVILQSKVTGCDSVITLHLSVGEGIETISDIKIDVIPNPVDVGATSFVYGNFGEIMEVEVIDNLGHVVDRFVPEGSPIEIRGIAVAGLYYVRIMCTDGNAYLKKLIVR